jgi:hypothetical protein
MHPLRKISVLAVEWQTLLGALCRRARHRLTVGLV